MITETFIMVGGGEFLSENSSLETIVELLRLVVGHVRPKGAMYVALVLEALLRDFPEKGCALLVRAGVIGTMMQSCAANHVGEKRCEPDRIIVTYLTVLARAFVQTPQLIDTLPIAPYVPSFGPQQLVQLYFRLFDHERPDSKEKPLRQRLWLLLLLSLLPETSEAVTLLSASLLESFDQLMYICLDTFNSNVGNNQLEAYDVGYDSEEESVIAGYEEYGALLRISLCKVS